MSEERPLSVRTGTAEVIPGWVKFAFWGSVTGLVVALGTLFVVAVLYGDTIGLAPAACVVLGCTLTVLLSQPAGLAGIVAGAMVGAVIGGAVHRKRHSPRAM